MSEVKGVPVEIMCIDTNNDADNPQITMDAIATWSIKRISI